MATPLNTQQIPPVPSAMDLQDGQQKVVSQPWQQWFQQVRDKVNVITSSIVALAGNSTAGFLSSNGIGGINSRILTPGTGITITNQDGVLGNPTISATASGGSPINIVNNTAANYTVQLADLPNVSSNVGWVASNVAGANFIQIDTHANQAIPIGAHLYVSEEGNGTTTIKALTGVTFVGPTITGVAKGVGEAVQIATDTWHIFGNLNYQIFTSYATVILADTPIAYWHLGESSGTTAADSSGNAYNGTYTGTYLQGQASILPSGYGASFNTSGTGYVLLPSTAGLTGVPTPLSLEAWIYVTSVPTSLTVLLDVGGSGSPQMSISAVTTGKIRFSFSALVNASAESTGSVAASTKTHVIITCTSGGTVNYYLQGAASGTATITVHTGSGAGRIGDYYTGGFIFPGSLQEVAVYNYVLTPTQVAAHYAAG